MSQIPSSVRVTVPATSANLGPGFDTLGLALSLHDTLEFSLSNHFAVEIEGEGAAYLPKTRSHLVVSSLYRACELEGYTLPQEIFLHAHNRIPQARGLGSSAEAIVAGVTAAAHFMGKISYDSSKCTEANQLEWKQWVFETASRIEGHPDNVAPAVFGGLTASWQSNNAFHTVNTIVRDAVSAIVFVPDYKVSTEAARTALPEQVPYDDAIFNVSRVGILQSLLSNTPVCHLDETAMNTYLFEATADKLHQDYRAPMMKPSYDLVQLLRSKGYASTISGAGPTVLLLHIGDIVDEITPLFEAYNQQSEVAWTMLPLAIDADGVMTTVSDN